VLHHIRATSEYAEHVGRDHWSAEQFEFLHYSPRTAKQSLSDVSRYIYTTYIYCQHITRTAIMSVRI